MPPFIALLVCWRPLLSSIYETIDVEGSNLLAMNGKTLIIDALILDVSIAMISPSWIASLVPITTCQYEALQLIETLQKHFV